MVKEDHSQIVAILSYLLIGIIWYFVDDSVRKSAFAKYHVKQAIILFVASIIWHIVWSIVTFILVMVTFGLFAPIAMLGYFVPCVLAIFGIVNAVNKQQKPVPIIGQYASKLTF